MNNELVKFAVNQANNMLVHVMSVYGEKMDTDVREKFQEILNLLSKLSTNLYMNKDAKREISH